MFFDKFICGEILVAPPASLPPASRPRKTKIFHCIDFWKTIILFRNIQFFGYHPNYQLNKHNIPCAIFPQKHKNIVEK